MLYWNILCVLLMTLPLSTDAVSCEQACEMCEQEPEWERRVPYCAKCRECQEGSYEITLGPGYLKKRPVSQINVKVPNNADCVPLCDPDESGELYKLQIVTTPSKNFPYPTKECVPTTCPPITTCHPMTTCNPITCAPTAPAPSTPPCCATRSPEGNYPPLYQPKYPPPCQPNCPPPYLPIYPPHNQLNYPPYKPKYLSGDDGAQESGKTREPAYLYIGIPKNMQV